MNRSVCFRLVLAAICSVVLGCAGTIAPSRQNPADYSVMESAVEGCDIAKTKALVGADQQIVNKQGWSRTTPLYLAAQNNCLEVARFLLENGALVDSRSSTGATPLHIAAEKGNIPIASLLLSHKADINAVDAQHRTPLDRALAWGRPDMTTFLKQHGGRPANR
jgi:ankyrin repeat protein